MLKNCFAKKGKATYYLKSNGTLAKGRLKIQKYWYSFHRETGELVRKGGTRRQMVPIIMPHPMEDW